MESSDPGVHKALAVPARRVLLAALTDAAEPLDNRQLAGLVGQHLTTVRHHLTALVEAGLVEVRQEEPNGGRGRPRLLYAAAPAREQLAAYRTLVEVLALGFGASRDERSVRAGEAGRIWGAAEQGTGGSLTGQVLAAAKRWGFEPELRTGAGSKGSQASDGGEVLLHGCPFQHNAERHPEVVCSVHQGLLDAMAERAGQPGTLRLHPFVGPGICSISMAGHLD
ncbi:helix-turn-helix domain-containing protein [Kitasatospora sp. GP82]|uniref:helix-turn-helix transcriptional regulator n=1 Tax=Kitasatospora sp. GP82 TaxID=3035089 RepID=UPI00247328F3|nr:helix-turn-helix domain-containing protein [Kitasatospora sp. GP82]MDH6124664.1 putative ArsR family transcriptional regulator [Kitasatospora sp. GP82]